MGEYLNTKEAAKFLCVSDSKMQKMSANRTIGLYKMGRKNLFKVTVLEEFIEKNRVYSVDELKKQAEVMLRGVN